MAVVDPSQVEVGPANLRGPHDLHVVLHGPRAACVEGVAPSPGEAAYLRDLRDGAFASLKERKIRYIYNYRIQSFKWPDKSTTSYDRLDFKSYLKNLSGKYLAIERHMLQIQGILLQYLYIN